MACQLACVFWHQCCTVFQTRKAGPSTGQSGTQPMASGCQSAGLLRSQLCLPSPAHAASGDVAKPPGHGRSRAPTQHRTSSWPGHTRLIPITVQSGRNAAQAASHRSRPCQRKASDPLAKAIPPGSQAVPVPD